MEQRAHRDAAESLLAWWRAAGVDVPAPLPSARSAKDAARAKPSPQQRSFADRVRPSRTNEPARKKPAPAAAPAAPPQQAGVEDARKAVAACNSLAELKAAAEAFTGHPLRESARNMVFARGADDAPVMVIGEGPGRDEDAQGLPFVGRSGKLLDAMFAAIDMSDQAELYVTNIVNWRPPGNRAPNQEEVALSLPFIERHIALKQPKLIVLAGGVSAQALLNARQGIMRLRGNWSRYAVKDAKGDESGDAISALPIFHPAFLLRRPIAKREAWRDLLSLKEKFDALTD